MYLCGLNEGNEQLLLSSLGRWTSILEIVVLRDMVYLHLGLVELLRLRLRQFVLKNISYSQMGSKPISATVLPIHSQKRRMSMVHAMAKLISGVNGPLNLSVRLFT